MPHEIDTNKSVQLPERRGFFQWITYGLSGVAALAVGVPLVGYLLGVRRTTPTWVTLDEVDKFPLEETRLKTFDNPLRQPWDGMTGFTGVYVRRTSAGANPKFLVFAVNCAHLGCPVSWFPQSGLFMCPCHGGVYYENGERASGPPPRGLYHCEWRVKNGRLEVQAPHYPSLQDTLTKES
jgi:Rieske Fe-S protein